MGVIEEGAWYGRVVGGAILLAIFGVVTGILALFGVELDHHRGGWVVVGVAVIGGSVLIALNIRDRCR